jgi:hypothetical protein
MDAGLSTAITLLKVLKEFLQKFRENWFSSWKETAQKVCDENRIPPEFKRTRISKRNRLHDYEGEDSDTTDLKEKFYRNYFLCFLDQGMLCIEERIAQLAEHNNNFGFLYNIQTLRSMKADNLKKYCMDLDILLQDGDSRNINGMDLYHEIIFCQIVDSSYTTPIQHLQLLHKTRDSFPNLAIALSIMLTMPITTSRKKFFKIKSYKNYMRTTMGQ